MLLANPRASREAYPADLAAVMNIQAATESRSWLMQWPGLNPDPTPVYELPDLAKALGVAALYVKDESMRSSLGSFKALGAPIALARLALKLGAIEDFDPSTVWSGGYAERFLDVTVTSATDGNHGRALAAAARSIGFRCVIVLHEHVSQEREQAIAALGAAIVRIQGNYDASVAEAQRLAVANHWQVVSDTSYAGYEDIPRDVMQGYAIIGAEADESCVAPVGGVCPFTHVLLQGGVGGLAAGVVSYLWEKYGVQRPVFVVVEPEQADCLFQSAVLGKAAYSTGTVDSVMAGLACGEASPLAWRFLHSSVDAFVTVSDSDAIKAMKDLARGTTRDSPVVAGESGAAGLAGLKAMTGTTLAAQIGLGSSSRVLLINTEGATAPTLYESLVGESAEDVKRRQLAHRQRPGTTNGVMVHTA